MKKSIGIILMVLLFLSMATGLGFAIGNLVTIKSAEDGKSAYELSVEAGEFQGTVEEWLDWIKGEDGVSGREVEIKFDNVSKKILWKYVGEEDDKLKELVSLEEIAQEVETDLDASIKTLEEKVQGLEGVSGKVDALVEEIEAIKESLKTPGQTEIEKVKNEIKAAYEEAIAKAVKDLEDRLGKGDVTQEELNAVASQVTALQTELKSFKEKYDATEKAVDALQKDLEAAKKDLADVVSKVESKADVKYVDDKIKAVNDAIDALEQINHDYVSADAQLKADLEKTIADAKKEAVDEAVEEAKKLVDAAKAELQAAIDKKADAADVEAKIGDLLTRVDVLEKINHDFASADAALKTELEQLIANAKSDAISEAVKLVDDAKAELKDLIDDKADAADVDAKITDLLTRVEALEKINHDYVTDSELQAAVAKAKEEAVKAAAEEAKKLVEAAKAELQAAIDKKADAAEVQKQIEAVLARVEALEKINHDFVTDPELQDAVAKAKKEAVQAAVEEAKKLVEAAKTELQAAIDKKADAAEVKTQIDKLDERVKDLEKINHDYVNADAQLKAELEKTIADAVKAAKDEIQLAIEKAVNDLEDKIYDEIDNLKDLIESGKIEFYRNGNKIMYKFAGQNDSEGKVLIDLDADVVTGETVVFETRVTAEGTCIYWGYVGQDPAEYKLLANFNQARDKYTVKFVVDGQQYDVQTIVDGKKAQEPTAPTKPGYKFVGWYYGEYEWEFVGDSVTEDMVLVAKFSAFVVKEKVENKSVVYSFVTDKAEELENANTLEVQFTVKASEVVNVNYRLVNPSVDEFYVELVSEVSGDYVTYTLVVGHLSGVLSLTSNEVIALDFVLADGVEAANVTINYVEVVGSGSYLGQYTVGYNDKIEVK